MEDRFKFVDFQKYCALCKNSELPESSMPCAECLCTSVRPDSFRPVKLDLTDAGKAQMEAEKEANKSVQSKKIKEVIN